MLLGIPCIFIGLFGVVGLITGEKLVAGTLGAIWGYFAVVGAYELNRRKFAWDRGSKHADLHLMGGTIAASSGLIVSGAVHETMPALAIVPALSAILQASDGHASRMLSAIHTILLLAGIGVGIWFYQDGIIGKVLLERVQALP